MNIVYAVSRANARGFGYSSPQLHKVFSSLAEAKAYCERKNNSPTSSYKYDFRRMRVENTRSAA